MATKVTPEPAAAAFFELINHSKHPVVLPSGHALGSVLDAGIVGARKNSTQLTQEEYKKCSENPAIQQRIARRELHVVTL